MSTHPPLHAAESLLHRLRDVSEDDLPLEVWEAVAPADRPLFFRLLATAADLPRLTASRVLENPATLAT